MFQPSKTVMLASLKAQPQSSYSVPLSRDIKQKSAHDFFFFSILSAVCAVRKLQTVWKRLKALLFFHSAPPAVVWGQSGGLYPAALALTLTVTQPRGLPQPSGVTYGPAPHGKSKNGVRWGELRLLFQHVSVYDLQTCNRMAEMGGNYTYLKIYTVYNFIIYFAFLSYLQN